MNDVVNELLNWYQENKRDLPWRKDRDPYHVWISEIMLQQTRVEAVISYYERFMKDLPDISSLAKVDEDRLRELGYVSMVHMYRCFHISRELFENQVWLLIR